MIIGFTGTRREINDWQKEWIRQQLTYYNVTTFHHGDCVGADAAAHDIAIELGARVWIHPPTDSRYRAYCNDAFRVLMPKPYLICNRDIVDDTKLMLAVPGGLEVKRSGTWSTVRYAQSVNRTVYLCPVNVPSL